MDRFQQATGNAGGVPGPPDVDGGADERGTAGVRTLGGVASVFPIPEQFGTGGQVFGYAVAVGMCDGLGNPRIPFRARARVSSAAENIRETRIW